VRDSIQIHPKVEAILAGFEAKELHASRSGREVMEALGSVVSETQAANLEDFASELNKNIDGLAKSLQAYAPTINVLHTVYTCFERALEHSDSMNDFQARIGREADAYAAWSQQARSQIASIGKSIIPPEGVVYTFTLSETVMRTLLDAWHSGVHFRVLITESRPNNDGRRSAQSLAEEGVPVEISIDACMTELIPKADLMIVGAEAILVDGSAICKVGTYPSALVASQCDKPVYILADSMKFYANSLHGKSVSLDPIKHEEVIGAELSETSRVEGHLFDRTPPELIKAIITELGILHPSQVSQHILTMPISESIVNRI
jgi:translation initiation factor 2B subunit (eIF-2B alpha/beta/delta family)